MKSDINPMDEIEVLDEKNGLYGRICIYEGVSHPQRKSSIFLTPDQLVAHANDCLTLANKMRSVR